MARQYLQLTPETTWGTYNSGGSHTIVQLDQNNAFTMRPNPIRWEIRSAGGFNRRVQTGSSKTSLTGNLNSLCYGSQMGAFGTWIVATSANVLPSVTIDHVVVQDDASLTPVYRRYLGVMVQQAQFTAGEQNQLMRMQLQLIAKQPATITSSDFAEPAANAYPSDAPYVFEHANNAFTFGSSRAEFEEFDITIKNMLDGRFMASQYLTRLKYCGRDVDFNVRFPMVTTVDRTSLEAVTAVTSAITFTNGAHSLAFQMNTANYVVKVDDDLALDKVHMQAIEAKTFFDTSASPANDFSLTVV